MSWANGLSQQEKDEMYLDACEAFEIGQINEEELVKTLAQLGYNATDIRDIIREHRGKPPEGD